jgi:tRNA pseudouridine32 synthase/23S rRNA pseudouridine746 synthase
LSLSPDIYCPPPDNGLDLCYCDEALLVVNKPTGLLAVPGRGEDKQDCLAVRVQREFPDALVVHRLDMATSGLIVFARGEAMQRRLSEMFREREVDKRYTALVAGKLDETGEIDLPIAANWSNRPLRMVDVDAGKHSLTRYRLSAYDVTTGISRVELEPVTGRTHQLRVHMAAIRHAIVGDPLYGGASAERLMLHASAVGLAHPLTQVRLRLSSPAPF